jgi:glycosyltransferase involved in cell wall biosynthesis
MKISGFTFLRNGTLMGYPYLESIKSILQLVDEFVVNIGAGNDDTYERIAAIADPKIRIIRSQWNEGMHAKGFVYAQQKMIAQYNCTGDWAFYLEGDEVLHENDLDRIRDSMLLHLPNPKIEALAFHYHHFYGTPHQVAASAAWYRNEVRVIRNTIRTYAPDGLYWVVMPSHRRGRYPYAAHTGAHIYHYGWARSAARMAEKIRHVAQYWDGVAAPTFDYGNIDSKVLMPFSGSHPKIIEEWLKNEAEHNFSPNQDYRLSRRDKKHRISMQLEKWFGWDLSKKHYLPAK